MKLAQWKHPKTGQVRIYANDVVDGFGVKIWLELDGTGYKVKCFAEYPVDQDLVADRIADYLDELNGGERVWLWGDIINLVK